MASVGRSLALKTGSVVHLSSEGFEEMLLGACNAAVVLQGSATSESALQSSSQRSELSPPA